MIEVEKKFQPTEEQLAALLKDCEFVKEVINHDLYYDYPDYRLWKNGIFFRSRNGNFEVKNRVPNTDSYEELEDEESIKKFFKTEKELSVFIKENLIVSLDFETNRKKYKKDKFIIDLDELNFGYKCVEIEVLVSEPDKINDAKESIMNFAKLYNFDLKEVSPKRKEYFRIVKPDVYNELYGKTG
jgi:adenylate cyclase class IV